MTTWKVGARTNARAGAGKTEWRKKERSTFGLAVGGGRRTRDIARGWRVIDHEHSANTTWRRARWFSFGAKRRNSFLPLLPILSHDKTSISPIFVRRKRTMWNRERWNTMNTQRKGIWVIRPTPRKNVSEIVGVMTCLDHSMSSVSSLIIGDASIFDTSGISFEWNSIPVGQRRELAEESRPSEAVVQIPERSWEPCAGDICGRVRNAFTKNTETPGWQPVPPLTRLPRPSLYRFLSDGVSRYSPSHHLSRSSPSPDRLSLWLVLFVLPPAVAHRPLTQSLSRFLPRPRVPVSRFSISCPHVKQRWTSRRDRSLLWGRVSFPTLHFTFARSKSGLS